MFWLGLSKLTFSQTLPIFWVKVEVLCRCKQFITIASVICRTFEWRWRSHFQAANMSKLPRGLHCLSQNCPISCQLMESMSTCRLGIYFATSSTLKPFITKLQKCKFPLLIVIHLALIMRIWWFNKILWERSRQPSYEKVFILRHMSITCMWQENNLFLYQIMSYINQCTCHSLFHFVDYH